MAICVAARKARVTIEHLSRRPIRERRTALVGQKTGHRKEASSTVSVVGREIRLPTDTYIEIDAPVQVPGVLNVGAKIVIAIVLSLGIGLGEGAGPPQQEVRQHVGCIRSVETELAIRNVVAQRVELDVDVIYAERDLVRPANNVHILG